MKFLKLISFSFLGIIIIIFAVYNRSKVVISIPFTEFSFEIAVYFIILIAFLFGAISGYIVHLSDKLKLIGQIKKNKEIIGAMNNEIAGINLSRRIEKE